MTTEPEGPSRYQRYRDQKRGGPPRSTKPHGTVAAARRHQKAKEPLCDLCKIAWAEHQAEQYQKRKARKAVDSNNLVQDGEGVVVAIGDESARGVQLRSLQSVIGENLRRERVESRRMTCDQFARLLSDAGMTWTATTVSKVEQGDRAVSLEELVLISMATGRPPAWLLRGPDRQHIVLSDPQNDLTTTAVLGLVRFWFEETDPAKFEAYRDRRESFRTDPRNVIWKAQSYDAERKAAKKLGVTPWDVVKASQARWDVCLTDHRDEVLAIECARRGIPLEGSDSPARTIQALRGHITRKLVDELAQDLNQGEQR